MTSSHRAQYCRRCQCHSMFRWVEPNHYMYSALTVVMIGTSFLTPATGVILLGLWAQRIASTRRWACPRCAESTVLQSFAA